MKTDINNINDKKDNHIIHRKNNKIKRLLKKDDINKNNIINNRTRKQNHDNNIKNRLR